MMPWVNVDKLRLTSDADTNKKIVVTTLHSRFPVLDAKAMLSVCWQPKT